MKKTIIVLTVFVATLSNAASSSWIYERDTSDKDDIDDTVCEVTIDLESESVSLEGRTVRGPIIESDNLIVINGDKYDSVIESGWTFGGRVIQKAEIELSSDGEPVRVKVYEMKSKGVMEKVISFIPISNFGLRSDSISCVVTPVD